MELLWFFVSGTMFAYGQTSSGKTYNDWFWETDPGITRKSVRDVFDRIQMVGGIKIYWIFVKLPQEYNF